jgi:hypothetical protein
MDMMGFNPGEAPPDSAFSDPKLLAAWGYNSQVIFSLVEGVPTFDALGKDLVPAGSKQRAWAEDVARKLEAQIRAAHAAGIKCYAWMQVLVLPEAVVANFKGEICDAKGRIDIHRPKTQELFRAQLREIFERLPELDGLVIRTGEIYLHDFPYHVSSGAGEKQLEQSNTIILHGPESHIDILQVLRDEVCVKLNKPVFYRTWDFGFFHTNPDYYLKVTNAIEPHPNLIFSIKHAAGDFHQLTPFNPTLTIGKHRQIVEVQCQREGYGKGAHPYYIGQGIIDGWEEYAWLMKPGQPKGLRDIAADPHYAGVWTWTRGGGWSGPHITNELWCALNAYVIAKWAQAQARGEAEILKEYAASLGLTGKDIDRFVELNRLSTQAVLRGQLTTLGAQIDVWWARDDYLKAPDLSDFIAKGLVEQALREKHEAVTMWERIETLARQIDFKDAATKNFVATSATYGHIKYAIIEQGWIILLYGKLGDAAGKYDKPKMTAAIAAYDRLCGEWRQLKATNPACSTIYNGLDAAKGPGLGYGIEGYRQKLAGGPNAAARKAGD